MQCRPWWIFSPCAHMKCDDCAHVYASFMHTLSFSLPLSLRQSLSLTQTRPRVHCVMHQYTAPGVYRSLLCTNHTYAQDAMRPPPPVPLLPPPLPPLLQPLLRFQPGSASCVAPSSPVCAGLARQTIPGYACARRSAPTARRDTPSGWPPPAPPPAPPPEPLSAVN